MWRARVNGILAIAADAALRAVDFEPVRRIGLELPGPYLVNHRPPSLRPASPNMAPATPTRFGARAYLVNHRPPSLRPASLMRCSAVVLKSCPERWRG